MRKIRGLSVLLSLFICISISRAQSTGGLPIIPAPVKVTLEKGSFTITPSTKIYSSPPFLGAARRFASIAGMSQANVIAINAGNKGQKAGGMKAIWFRQIPVSVPADTAGYRLHIQSEGIMLTAGSVTGALYGFSSLSQLVLLEPGRSLPAADIVDRPRFAYRGLMLDVSRNFYPPAFIRELIDYMALYKMNTLHWHLTDGPGWRLEIKKYPLLTGQTAWRTDNDWKDWRQHGSRFMKEGDPMAYGGYYTQEQARELVAYAAERGITVIPEIEMPGHSGEVTTAYPSLSCSGLPYTDGELCPGNDSVLTFLEGVLTEVMQVFPSTYIHIGGDEAGKESWKHCPKCQARIRKEGLADETELQSWLIRKMDKFLIAHGRKLLGWDEILEGGLAQSATVMSWRGESGGIKAARMDHDVVMTPGNYCYFDHYQADPRTQPEAIGGYLDLKTVYSYEPIPAELEKDKQAHVLGAQANLWTEYVAGASHAQYMIFPRLLALAEVTWSPAKSRDWAGFRARLYHHYRLLQGLNINYCRPSAQVDIRTDIDYHDKSTLITMESEQYDPVIRYTLDRSLPGAKSRAYTGPFRVHDSARLRAAVFYDTVLQGIPVSQDVDYHKAIGKTVIYNLPYDEHYPAQKDSTLTNGHRGSLNSYGDGQWQGFTQDLDITLDLERTMSLSSVSLRFMQMTGPGVFMPDWAEVSVSEDGRNFTPVKRINNDVPATVSTLVFKDFRFGLDGRQARFIRVFAKNPGGFLFTDEMIVY